MQQIYYPVLLYNKHLHLPWWLNQIFLTQDMIENLAITYFSSTLFTSTWILIINLFMRSECSPNLRENAVGNVCLRHVTYDLSWLHELTVFQFFSPFCSHSKCLESQPNRPLALRIAPTAPIQSNSLQARWIFISSSSLSILVARTFSLCKMYYLSIPQSKGVRMRV